MTKRWRQLRECTTTDEPCAELLLIYTQNRGTCCCEDFGNLFTKVCLFLLNSGGVYNYLRFTYIRSKDKRSNDKRSNDRRPKDKRSNDKRSKDKRSNWTQGRIRTQGRMTEGRMTKGRKGLKVGRLNTEFERRKTEGRKSFLQFHMLHINSTIYL